jgi:hypothetical protein
VQADEIIWINKTHNHKIRSPYHGMIIMPNASVENGGEWCYFWKIINP